MKICIVGPYPPIKGGISKYNQCLMEELKKSCDVKMFSYKRQYPGFLVKNREQIDENYHAGTDLQDINWDLDSVNPVSWFSVLRQIKRFKPDLVLLPWWVIYWAPMYMVFMFYFRLRGIRSMLLCHNVFEHEDAFLKRMVTSIVLKMADTYLVHTDSEERKLEAIVGSRPCIKYLHPLYVYAGNRTEVDSSQEAAGTLNLLFFGFIREYKGLDLLLEAMALLNNARVKLTIAGEFWGDKKKYLDILEAGNIKNVEIVDGYVSDDMISGYFEACDLVVLPYRSATGSGIIATAYGYGKPVLVTNVGGLPEAVSNKITGFVTEPTPDGLAEGIGWFLKEQDRDFREDIEKFVNENMSWRGLCEKIYGLIESK